MHLSGVVVALLAVVCVLLAAVLIVALILLVRLLRLWSLVNSDGMPIEGKIAFWGALVYAISPIDLLPDPVYLDDAGVLFAAIAFIGNLARKNGLLGAPPGPGQRPAQGSGQRPAQGRGQGPEQLRRSESEYPPK